MTHHRTTIEEADVQHAPTLHRARPFSLTLLAVCLLVLSLIVPWGAIGSQANAADEIDRVQTQKTDDGASLTMPVEIEPNEEFVITGENWTTKDDKSGSRIAVKFDGGTTQMNGTERGIVAIVDAEDNGSFTQSLPFPTDENSNQGWAPGEEHSITLLTGSLKDNDKVRSLVIKFKVASEEEVDREDRDNWVKTTAEAQGDHEGAIFWVQPFQTGEDSKLRISGEGWTDVSGEGGSTISVKVQYEAEPGKIGQYSRTDSVINDYLESKGRAKDPTSWALLVPEGAAEEDAEHGLFTVKPDGSFDVEVDAPEELRNGETGQYLTIFAQAGRNMDGDVSRAGTSDPVPVNGIAADPIREVSDAQCVNVADSPTARIETPQTTLGGTLHLVGEGWCNPGGETGAARVAVKIDEGGISRLDSDLHSNRTIWALVDPDQNTGVIDAEIQLPDGTEKTSTPVLTEGSHSLRLLSGSLKPGDLTMTFGGTGVLDFTVGEYQPNGFPDTVADSELNESSRKGVDVSLNGSRVTATVPEGREGQWVMATPYADGSVRSQWGSGWKQLDGDRRLSYDLPEDVNGGDYKLVVQNGEMGSVGEILGWDDLRIEKQDEDAAAPSAGGTPSGAAGSSGQAVDSGFVVSPGGWLSAPSAIVSNIAVPGVGSSSLAQSIPQAPVQRLVARPPAKRVITIVKKSSTSPEKKTVQVKESPKSSSSAKAEARSDSGNDQAGASSIKERSFLAKVLSWNNVLLILAGALLLILVLTGGSGHKPGHAAGSQDADAS